MEITGLFNGEGGADTILFSRLGSMDKALRYVADPIFNHLLLLILNFNLYSDSED